MTRRETTHERWMRRALALAAHGEGLTRPNPPVGAILVRRGRMVGQGYHRRAGGPHAEVLAIRKAGCAAKGATLYITMEPCSTWGRTPPCTDAILASGVRHVVVGARDPNPRHAGRGLRLLRRQGVKITEGVCLDEAAELIAPFARWMNGGRSFVTLKMGPSLDGRIADRKGSSRWITGPKARAKVQQLRRKADAVMVAAGTVAADNPSLMPRPAKGRTPFRVIVDSAKALAPLNAKVFTDEHAEHTILAVPEVYPVARVRKHRARGVQVVILPSVRGRIKLSALFGVLAKAGILHVLCEGGGQLAASLVEADCVDRFVFFVAPRIIGDRDAPMVVAGRGWLLKDAPYLRFIHVEQVGSDIMIQAKPECTTCLPD